MQLYNRVSCENTSEHIFGYFEMTMWGKGFYSREHCLCHKKSFHLFVTFVTLIFFNSDPLVKEIRESKSHLHHRNLVESKTIGYACIRTLSNHTQYSEHTWSFNIKNILSGICMQSRKKVKYAVLCRVLWLAQESSITMLLYWQKLFPRKSVLHRN